MSDRVIIEEQYREAMRYLKDPVEMVIKDGRVVAVIGGVTASENRPDWMPAPPTKEEFERMKAGPWFTTEEVFECLKSVQGVAVK